MPDPFAIECVREARAELVEAMLDHSIAKLTLALKLWNPDQPRVPAGSSGGGQWIGAPAESSTASHVHLTQVERIDKYRVDLQKEDAYGGHGFSDHVGKTDEELLAEIQKSFRRVRQGNFEMTLFKEAVGTFRSSESANDLVNRTLEDNKQEVEEVSRGDVSRATLDKRFGYQTGQEAFKPSGDESAYIRPTYSIRVIIQHDPQLPRGYRVQTAFPVNQRPSQ